MKFFASCGKGLEYLLADELMALGGRYRTMFDLQASRFATGAETEEGLDVLD